MPLRPILLLINPQMDSFFQLGMDSVKIIGYNCQMKGIKKALKGV